MKNFNRFLMLVLLSSCNPAARISVTNVNDAGQRIHSACIYALPQTAFAITVTARQESFVPGPFHMYARKYLGISDAISAPGEQWTLLDASLAAYVEVDPDFLFSVDGVKGSLCSQIVSSLRNDSLILLPADFVSRREFTNKYDTPPEPLTFTDLSVKRNFEADKSILITETLPDSSYFTTPSVKNKKIPVTKTLEQKAEEAANFIIKIRKRRFKLISGQYDFMPDGEALGRAVEELNRTEEAYLSLFIGKKNTSIQTCTFHYVPEAVQGTGRTILFRFSEKEGFLGPGENNGKPAMIVIQDMNKTKGLDAFARRPGGLDKGLVYRIPDQAWIRLQFGEQLLLETRQPVYQFGSLISSAL
jgi:hypothetical protein